MIMMLIQQFLCWWVLYRFLILRRKMSNKLHVYNLVMVAGNTVAGAAFLVFARISAPLDEYPDPGRFAVVYGLMVAYVLYQENNTNSYISFDMHKRIGIHKRMLNQWIGFLACSLVINIMWITMSAGISLTVFGYAYLLLILIQFSLSYTTYGQSKHWNFTYEAVMLIHILAFGLQRTSIITVIIGCAAGILMIWRQCRMAALKTVVVGVLVFLVTASSVTYLTFYSGTASEGVSALIPYALIPYLAVACSVYLMEHRREVGMILGLIKD